MRYGFSLIVRGEDATPETFVKMAERAEALEMDSLWLSAHVVLPPQVKSGYVLIPGRKHPPHWRECYWEPFTVLSFLAAHTTRITLGTSVVVLPMHNPFECAKQVAEVDRLSNGRFVFGLGVGWFEEEFEVLGQDFGNRGARTDDAIELMKMLWAEDPVTYKGRFYSCEDVAFSPKPVQRPHPPIWVARREPTRLPPRGTVRRGLPPGADAAREGRRDARGAGRRVRKDRARSGLGQALPQAAARLPGGVRASSPPKAPPGRSWTASNATSTSAPGISRSISSRRRRTSRLTRWNASRRKCGHASTDRKIGPCEPPFQALPLLRRVDVEEGVEGIGEVRAHRMPGRVPGVDLAPARIEEGEQARQHAPREQGEDRLHTLAVVGNRDLRAGAGQRRVQSRPEIRDDERRVRTAR